MRCLIIENSVVVNSVEASAEFAHLQGWLVSETGEIGDLWDGVDFSAPETTHNIPRMKLDKNAEINAARLAANFSTFTHAGKVFACDQLSRSDIDGTNGFVALYGTLPPGWPGGWKAADNSYLPIVTVEDWKAFYSAMFATGSANFAKSQALKARVELATTAEEINLIGW